MSKKAIVEELSEVFSGETLLKMQGYTHVVLVGHSFDLEDVVDFKNEFAARTYADAVNMGLGV
jgi:hypothetical protein